MTFPRRICLFPLPSSDKRLPVKFFPQAGVLLFQLSSDLGFLAVILGEFLGILFIQLTALGMLWPVPLPAAPCIPDGQDTQIP